jgi:hypothetical protein
MNEPLEGAPSKGSWEDIPSRTGGLRLEDLGEGHHGATEHASGIHPHF